MAVTATFSALPKGSLVLVTGVNGYIASHIADQLLAHGFAVRGTVRSADKGAWIQQAFSKRHPTARFEMRIVPDMAQPGAFDDAMHAVHAVAHVASNVSFAEDPHAVIPETITGLRHVMHTAAQHASVTRFVYTSSSTAAAMPRPNEKFAIDASTWNDDSVKAAWAPPPYDGRAFDVYAASKTEAEREAWKFIKEEKPAFVLNAVLPNFNLGAILHAKQPASTAGWLRSFYLNPEDQAEQARFRGIPPQYVVDVVDDALLHVAALTEADVQNERLFGYAHAVNYNSWLEMLRKVAPEKKWPADDPEQGHDLSVVDTKRAEELLRRFGKDGWTSFEDSLRATIEGPPQH